MAQLALKYFTGCATNQNNEFICALCHFNLRPCPHCGEEKIIFPRYGAIFRTDNWHSRLSAANWVSRSAHRSTSCRANTQAAENMCQESMRALLRIFSLSTQRVCEQFYLEGPIKVPKVYFWVHICSAFTRVVCFRAGPNKLQYFHLFFGYTRPETVVFVRPHYLMGVSKLSQTVSQLLCSEN